LAGCLDYQPPKLTLTTNKLLKLLQQAATNSTNY
jgi:hypothetical protein